MLFKKEIRKPIIALIFISLGGWMLHFRAHPITADADNLLPFFFGLVDVIITPILFNHKKTVIVAYLINGISVIVGTIAMATFSIYRFSVPVTLGNIIGGLLIVLLHPKIEKKLALLLFKRRKFAVKKDT